MHNLVNKKMLEIKKFELFQHKSFYLLCPKIFTFFFCNIDRRHYEKNLLFDFY